MAISASSQSSDTARLLKADTLLPLVLPISKEQHERFSRIIFVHGVRTVKESAVVHEQIARLKSHEILGQDIRKLRCFTAVTREPHINQGKRPLITALT